MKIKAKVEENCLGGMVKVTIVIRKNILAVTITSQPRLQNI
jgi:hypothetical protein